MWFSYSDGKKSSKKQKVDVKDQPESGKDPSKKEANKMTLQQPKADKKETTEKKSIEQRVQPISLHSLSCDM